MSVRVKICGITSAEQAQAVADAGADAIGIVFYAPSPRAVMDMGLAREIAETVGPYVSVNGLFVNAEPALIETVLTDVGLSGIQFHGDEDPVTCQHYARPFVKAVRMRPDINLGEITQAFRCASALLLDTYVKGVPGGTGATFNWHWVPKTSLRPVVLAGGLTPENVREAVATAQPYGVDVSGGVESAPGIKDIEKVQAFITNAKAEMMSE